MQTHTAQKRQAVAYAKFKHRDAASGKLVYLPGTRRFPIQARPEFREQAIQKFIDRTARNPKSRLGRHDIFCYIEDAGGKHLLTLLGGHPYDPKHRSAFRLVHLDGGKCIATLWSQKGDELNMETAPWQLVNRYRPQRKTGNVAVYDTRGNIVERNGKKLRWQDGQRKP